MDESQRAKNMTKCLNLSFLVTFSKNHVCLSVSEIPNLYNSETLIM